ncbi:GNAT family N-acetyltransferase [Pseudodesulfovibrio sp. zrk46]|uniref:GNAT family N-acetyltransferase n=1 Tax=Pseudodesulfovibrio sp. zrk46 TaxID=2725288 RepID=UPI001448E81A|nr:GNAT family N-acetyltransferase [Pseudodesulfovibrio sp. zrk46]QJB56442.1 GNAT family N-acetyltransferase [Pseudodesulfovibrio sp. zrk46]
MTIQYKDTKSIDAAALGALYQAQGWKSGDFPETIAKAMEGSDLVISAWDKDRLVGLAAVLSDGHLVAYLSYLLVHPDYHGQGIGHGIMERLVERYKHVLRKVLISFDEKCGFYERYGFKGNKTRTPMYRREYDTDY